MNAVFLKLLNMSLAAGWLILALMVLRLILKKSPRWISCALWSLAALRLLCPLTLESSLSLIPSSETINPRILSFTAESSLSPHTAGTVSEGSHFQEPLFHSGIPALNSTLNPALEKSLEPKPGTASPSLSAFLSLSSLLWLLGLLCLLGYALFRYLGILRVLREAVPFRDNIFLCDAVETPFILGIIRPGIYLPSGIGREQADYVIAHEQAHLKRKDHWWKLLGYLLLSVYWFHPLCWAAYLLFCRDMELACDEKVIRHMSLADKKAYSQALLSLSTSGRLVFACPPAFGEVGIKKRVEAVLHYKKPAFFTIPAACVGFLAIALCFLTSRETPSSSLQSAAPQSAASELIFFHGRWYRQTDFSPETVEWLLWYNSLSGMEQAAISSIPGELWDLEFKFHEDLETMDADAEGRDTVHPDSLVPAADLDSAIQNAILEENKASYATASDFACCDFFFLDSQTASGPQIPGSETVTCYGWALYEEYLFLEEGLEEIRGSYLPVAISFLRDEAGYHRTEYWIPREGGYFAEDIRSKFPEAIVNDALDSQKFRLLQEQRCYDQAVRKGNLHTDAIIEGLLKTLSSEPEASSNPQDYLNAHAKEYHELLYYGEYTLGYCFARFRRGGETGLEGKLMALVCEELLQIRDKSPADAASAATGQEWFDTLYAHGSSLVKSY